MELVKLGKKGQVSIPRSILKKLGLEGDIALLVDITGDGAIAARADIPVTGDRRHFGPLYCRSVHDVLILTPADALSRALDAVSPEGSGR